MAFCTNCGSKIEDGTAIEYDLKAGQVLKVDTGNVAKSILPFFPKK